MCSIELARASQLVASSITYTSLRIRLPQRLVDSRARGGAAWSELHHHVVNERVARLVLHRFSAYWLRSKCSVCSYQFKIWYLLHRGTYQSDSFWHSAKLIWFLTLGNSFSACTNFATIWPGIAVPPELSIWSGNNLILDFNSYNDDVFHHREGDTKQISPNNKRWIWLFIGYGLGLYAKS